MNLSHKLIKLFARSMLMLGLTASAAAWAVCDVSLVSVFANGQAVLKADCLSATISNIRWYQNTTNVAANAIRVANLDVVPTTQDIYYTTAITTGTSTFTATGNLDVVTAGKAATIISGQTALTTAVAPTATGTITCTTPTQPASNCTGASTYPVGTAVTLNAVGNTGYSLAGWGGDCNGTGSCVVVMTAPHTVVANFASTPVCILAPVSSSITAGASVTLAATCNPTATSYAWTNATCSTNSSTCTVTPSVTTPYTVAGTNGNGSGAPSNTATVNVTQAAPACQLSANPASVVFGTQTNVTLTAACSGSPSSYAWTTPANAPAATGSASTANVTFPANAAQGAYIYSVTAANGGGTSIAASTPVNVSSVAPPACTLTANPTSISAGSSSILTASCPTATSYVWSGATCSSASATCTVTPAATATYAVAGTNSGGVTGATASATVTVTPATTCTVVDATGWLPAGVSDPSRTVASAGGTIVSYKFTAAQLITGAPSIRGNIELYETTPEPQFEISNQPCDMTMPLPNANDTTSSLSCARVGVPGNRFPSLLYMAQDNPNNPAWSVYGVCALMAPAAGDLYYVNVKMAPSCGSSCQYVIFYQQQ
jgi:hypothetical protein